MGRSGFGGGGGGFSSGGSGFGGGFSGGGSFGGRSGGSSWSGSSGWGSSSSRGSGSSYSGGSSRGNVVTSGSGTGWLLPFMLGRLTASDTGGGGNNKKPKKDENKEPEYGAGCANVGCSVIVWIFVILLIIGLLGMAFSSSDYEYTSSGQVATAQNERTPLPAGSVNETGYYTDLDGDWVHNPSVMESGMKKFYDATGVQPYVIILPNNTTKDSSALTKYADEQYANLFSDEAHFLFVISYDSSADRVYYGYHGGSQARTVMDEEAMQIFLGYCDAYWYDSSIWQDSSYSEELFFSKVFESTANNIMKKNYTIYYIIAVVIIVIAVIIFLTLNKRRQAKLRQKEIEAEILATPLDTFGDLDTRKVAEKYDDAPSASKIAADAAKKKAVDAAKPWVCTNCGALNTRGTFCTKCGEQKSDELQTFGDIKTDEIARKYKD